MSIYGETGHMLEHKTQFVFKGKREDIAKVNIPNIAYSNQHTAIEIPHGLRDHVVVPDTVKTTFNLDIVSTGKRLSINKNVVGPIVKK